MKPSPKELVKRYQYLPEGGEIFLADESNPFLREACRFALEHAGSLEHFHAVVLVKDDKVIGRGSIGQGWHAENGCHRKKVKSGFYDCKGCHHTNHSEAKAISDAHAQGFDPQGADLYLWGHWWFCENCWDKMIAAGVRRAVVLDTANILFDKYDHVEENVVKNEPGLRAFAEAYLKQTESISSPAL